MNLYDHDRRLQDLERALTGLVRALAQGGHASVLAHAVSAARRDGVQGVESLLRGQPAEAAYRR